MAKWLKLAVVAAVVLALVLGEAIPGAYAYHKGDTLHLARRAQFKKVRTEWHEISGRFCPHFGVNGVVAVPLPKPQGFERGDDYKISLALGHYTFHSSWMKVIDGKKFASAAPMIQVNLVRAGEDVTGFRAKVTPLPKGYASSHSESVSHFRNETHWPKLLVVKYDWEEKNSVLVDIGILVITSIGVLVSAYLMLRIIANSRENLYMFVEEFSGNVEDSSAGGYPTRRHEDMIKGE
mmetsp:Transcript_6887/g.12644  ORF Transcript_6887/g.12644 Transcript_6887/m.12644 type:complete len:236 (-) Transcript_6887:57-764(-)|eukprot:CAMPEP_0197478930 /NCGR_PEP_ID=MMETSP1309-20131121/30299_1 /TAXON_ID=464262 /ORGANISM="Genus nov. species nov., Strain RCC998" /LENGTH=235 /DNA_ID=CAMNT_0043020479 /DNA_START=36 /DNA_END=743 /DNA_ORIENTATION=+